jgi:hypothetical protein
MAAKLTRLTHKIAIQLYLVTELYHQQFSVQAASPETFGFTLVHVGDEKYIQNFGVKLLGLRPLGRPMHR